MISYVENKEEENTYNRKAEVAAPQSVERVERVAHVVPQTLERVWPPVGAAAPHTDGVAQPHFYGALPRDAAAVPRTHGVALPPFYGVLHPDAACGSPPLVAAAACFRLPSHAGEEIAVAPYLEKMAEHLW